jgi:predicted Zn-dependent protease
MGHLNPWDSTQNQPSRNRWTRREALLKITLGATTLSVLPSLLGEEPHVLDHSRYNISDEDEIALGKKFAADLDKESPIASNSLIDNYLASVVHQLARKSQRPNMPYSIKLINSMEVNAFSIPGGGLYLNRGLFELMTSEDELAATLGHEIGHIVGRHAINELMITFQAKALLKPVLENLHKNNGVVDKIILQLGGAVAMLAMLHFSRQDEAQADLLGFYEMLRAGWDPHGFIKLFALLEKVEKASGGASIPIFSDHPPTPERLAAIQRELRQVRIPAGARTDSMSFHAAKTALHLLPDPPKPHKATAKN